MDLSLTQQYTSAHYQRGVVYSKTGNYRQAVASYTKAIDLDPDFVQAYYERCLAYQQLEEYAEALADLEHYMKIAPKGDHPKHIIETMNELRVGLATQSS